MPNNPSCMASEVDVELARLILVMGKGGVGKTTVAQGIASVLAKRGLETVLMELGTAAGARFEAAEEAGSAFATQRLSHEAALFETASEVFGSARIAKLVFGNFAVKQLVGVVPGVHEYCLLVAARARLSRYQRVVVDMPATGHGVSWLSAAAELARLVPHGPARAQADALDASLRSAAETSLVLVTLPEPMVLSESAELERALFMRLGVHVTHTVLNRVPAESHVPMAELSALARRDPAMQEPLRELSAWTEGRADALRSAHALRAAGRATLLPDGSARPSLRALQQLLASAAGGHA